MFQVQIKQSVPENIRKSGLLLLCTSFYDSYTGVYMTASILAACP